MPRPTDLHTDAARLRDAFEDLLTAWQVAQESWNDEVSRKYAEQHLEPLCPVLKNSLEAISRMSQLVDQMHQQCDQ
ncbi:MAG: hypothetical protein KDA61_01195 [Planctomycetales bacterium]|nr:hypothetical protein [Planctomycetales bacterium]